MIQKIAEWARPTRQRYTQKCKKEENGAYKMIILAKKISTNNKTAKIFVPCTKE